MKPPKGFSPDAFTNLVVAGTCGGQVKLIDLEKSKVISIIEAGSYDTTIFGLDWNEQGMLAIGSSDENAQIKKFEPATKSFSHVATISTNSPCRCVAWNPLSPSLVACGLFNGRIVIYDVERSSVSQILQGSDSRVLCMKWHPQFEYILAAGGFDHIVRVHDTKYTG